MNDFAHLFTYEELPDEVIQQDKRLLAQIDLHEHFADAILTELDETTSPTIMAMWYEARDAYKDALRTVIDLDPFVSAEEKERFLRVQGEARRYRDMVIWLAGHAQKYREAQDFNRDQEVQRIKAQREHDERPNE